MGSVVGGLDGVKLGFDDDGCVVDGFVVGLLVGNLMGSFVGCKVGFTVGFDGCAVIGDYR